MTTSQNLLRWSLPLACAILCAAPEALADRNDPGSLVIFPEYDSRIGSYTFLTVTNVHTTESVSVHFIYVDEESCLRSNAFKTLTARDTVTFYATDQAPDHGRGYCYAYALSSTTGGATDFDYLIASEITLDGTSGSEYSLNAMIFEGIPGHGLDTDLNSNGHRDLDGQEYSMTPDRIAIPRFFGQLDESGMPRAELILIGLTGTKFTTTANFLIYNDNEQGFSAQYSFDCWDRVPLLDISGVFGNNFLLTTSHAENEIQGFSLFESGWFEIDGGSANSTSTTIPNAAMLAALVEVSRMSSADLPFTIGEQSNGSLLPNSLSGN
jgi:hypothetical protein